MVADNQHTQTKPFYRTTTDAEETLRTQLEGRRIGSVSIVFGEAKLILDDGRAVYLSEEETQNITLDDKEARDR